MQVGGKLEAVRYLAYIEVYGRDGIKGQGRGGSSCRGREVEGIREGRASGWMYLVLQSCPDTNEVEGIDRGQALAPCKGHVSLGDFRTPGLAHAGVALHMRVLGRCSYIPVLKVICPGHLLTESLVMPVLVSSQMCI